MLTSVGLAEEALGEWLHTGDPAEAVPESWPVLVGQGSADADLLEAGPGPLVLVSRTVSAGLLTEERLANRPGFEIRTVGEQGDYFSARNMAFGIDRRLMRIARPVWIGGVRVSAFDWTGGGPTLLTRDSARRSHFTCRYIATTDSGLY